MVVAVPDETNLVREPPLLVKQTSVNFMDSVEGRLLRGYSSKEEERVGFGTLVNAKILDAEITPKELRKALGFSRKFGIEELKKLDSTTKRK
ncbi:hypothetical protein F441_01939 [Phytophthora nicotianae CJ01A1]|uniref:Uncharacterized protein n=3 Tax=Phytophthora nicotianae TaxID=4792 RepID=W2XRW1_PHYNI|nr:hypothetical protein L916_01853 [Phytophthora nicotianae]ETO84098.1 hypothetical protein F444_01975 [Phytophthora nicotianae P1976]ETP25138.1 hypothetical protein F441_01939 [Phytophthora nicotianae CJ01A1]